MTVTKTHFACGFDRWDELGLLPPAEVGFIRLRPTLSAEFG
jgi:hypothetical protein